MSTLVLHRAAWVLPVAAPSIQDGAVATAGDKIVAVGEFSSLASRFPDSPLYDHGNTALLPALVNAHIHLELSHLPIPAIRPEVSGFTDWIETMLARRAEHDDLGQIAEQAAREILQEQQLSGVIALGDIGNTDLGARLADNFEGYLLHFNECLGRTSATRRAILKRAAADTSGKMYTAHAPYSTHAEIIRGLKERANDNGHPFPIHTAEPPSENEMLTRGRGKLFDFLKGRGFVDATYTPPGRIDKPGSVQYLHDLGVLDANTICVHCIHISPREISLLADHDAKVCLCPGSNRYLKVGRAPVEELLTKGIAPALGTDSLASNPVLSLWKEMQLVGADYPGIDPARIIEMATLGGAKALGLDSQCGSLAPGLNARFLKIPLTRKIPRSTDLCHLLIEEAGNNVQWVNPS